MTIINPTQMNCGFCGRDHKQVERENATLYQGATGFVCTLCVDDIQADRTSKMADRIRQTTGKLLTPPEITARLSDYIVGQDAAKKVLSVAVFEHYLRTSTDMRAFGDDMQVEKSNILLVGPTGTGKTHFARQMAKVLDVAFYKADATSLTEAGYVGEDVESILTGLYAAADGNLERAQKGIVFLDEIDKLRKSGENLSTTRDVGGEGVQQSILKLIEGAKVRIQPQGGRRHPAGESIEFDTTNVLFICGGAFAGIEKLIAERKAKAAAETAGSSIGFGATIRTKSDGDAVEKNILHSTTRGDLTAFGMIPELLGRLPVLVTLDEVDEDLLVHILTEPKDAITKQMGRLFLMQGVALSFTEGALRVIARKALAEGTGARGLKTILEATLLETRYSMAADGVHTVTVAADGDNLVVDADAREAA